MIGWIAVAWAEEPHCPDGLVPAFSCARYGSYASLCVAPDTHTPTKIQLVLGSAGQPPTVLVPADGAPSAFTRGKDDDALQLRIRQGDTVYRLDRSDAYATITTVRGSSVTVLDCAPASPDLSGVISAVRKDPLADAPLPARAPAPSRCAPGQIDVMSCPIGAKALAVCRSASDPAAVQYRFGPPDHPDLVFPPTPSPLAAAPFQVAREQFAHTHTTTLSFTSGGFTYEVWSSDVDSGCCGDQPDAGVRVLRGPTKLAELPCTAEPKGSLEDLADQ